MRNIYIWETADEIKEILKNTSKDDPNYRLIYQDWCIADEEECSSELEIGDLLKEDSTDSKDLLGLDLMIAKIKKAKTMIKMAKKLLK